MSDELTYSVPESEDVVPVRLFRLIDGILTRLVLREQVHEVQCAVELVQLRRVGLGGSDFAEDLGVPGCASIGTELVHGSSTGDFTLDVLAGVVL